MTIEEHISGEVLLYDYEAETWHEIASLSDSNVESALTKRQCCADGAFEVGGVYGATLSIRVRLPDVTRNQLRSARIVLRSRYAEETDWEPVGEFWVNRVRATGDLFTISADDGMLWTDMETGESVISALLNSYPETTLEPLLGGTDSLTRITGVIIPAVQSGMQNVLQWAPYDEMVNGTYCNEYLCARNAQTGAWEQTSQPALVKPYAGSSVGKSTCPRDFYRWAAALAGGFVTIRRDGLLCLRQFGMEELGMAEIRTADMEQGSVDISDFQLWLQEVQLVPEVDGVSPVIFGMTDAGLVYDFDYQNHAVLRYKIESNPFLDGMCDRWIRQNVLEDAKPIAAALWRSFFNAGAGGDQVLQIRPFRATVHKPVRFELGQKIVLHYRDLHEAAETVYRSTVTSVEWKLCGGHTIACGGENARIAGGRMITKSDRVSRELLYRTR